MSARPTYRMMFFKRVRSCIWKEGDERMELLLYRLLCLAATLLCFFVIIPTNFLHHLSPWISLAVFVFGLATLHLSREACQGRYYLKTLFFLFLALMNLIWFPNGGSQGSVGYYYFIALLYAPIFFRGKERWLLLALAICNNGMLLAAELYLSQWVIPYLTTYHRTADLAVGFTVTALCCALMLTVMLNRYDREQQRLMTLNEELRQNLLELVQAQNDLKQNRLLLDAVVQGSVDAIFVKDTLGRYVLFNRAAERATGKSSVEVLGKDDTFLFSPQDARLVRQKDQEILSTRQTRISEITLAPVGRVTLREVTNGPVYDSEGKVIGLFGISRDVTESRRMAEELRSLNMELERRVEERTARLEAAMREQESFSYSVSHDLRGPLRHINSYTAILEEDFGSLLPSEAWQYTERIRNSSRRMGDLIDDLLELSRIGRSELEKVPVSLSELAGQIGQKLQDEEPGRQVEFLLEPSLQVHGDRTLLQQMLENLIGNAWKYSAPRELARIELGRGVFAGREAFFVRDNGVGFDMAYQDKLFGPFQRLHGSEFDGTGIGLATVKRIVERHDGAVWAQGAVDEGATIFFTFGKAD